MMKKIKRLITGVFLLSAAMLVGCGGNAGEGNNNSGVSTETETQEQTITDQPETDTAADAKAMQKVAKGNSPRVIDFWAEWCPPCKKMSPVFHSLEGEYTGKVKFESINVDEEQELAADYDITAIPTFVFIDSEGREISRLVGMVSADELRKQLDAISK